jgi:DNA polymerase III psi subunit
MSENNNILFQQLFAGEQIYFIPERQAVTQQEIMINRVETFVEEVFQPTIEVEKPKELLHFVPSHRVVILVNSINEADKILLSKILTAVKLDLSKIELMDLSELKKMNVKTALSQNLISHFITFGVPLPNIKLEIPLMAYQIKEIKSIRFLFSDELKNLHQDVERKKALWKALQEMFL